MNDSLEHWQDKCERYVTSLKPTNSTNSEAKDKKWYPEKQLTKIDEQNQEGSEMDDAKIPSVQNLATFVSLHGLPFAVSTKKWSGRSCWAFVIFSGCLALALLSYLFVSEYLLQRNVPVVTVSFDSYSKGQRFPAITVCNMNILRKSSLYGTVFENLTLLDDKPPTLGFELPVPEVERARGNTNHRLVNFTQEMGVLNAGKLIARIEKRFQDLVELVKDTDWEGLYKISGNSGFQHLKDAIRPSRDHLRKLGHHPRDTLTWGDFDGDLLSQSDIKETVHHKFGRCASITRDSDEGAHKNDALTLTLNLQSREYISFLNPAVGAFVFVHHPDDPISELSPLRVSPGELTNIAVQLQQVSRSSLCKRETGYTVQTCRLRCLYNHQRSLCGCSQDFDRHDARPCSITNREEYVCTGVLAALHAEDRLPCDCPEKCHENVYKISQSKIRWPSERYLPHFKAQMTSRGYAWSDEDIRQNIAQVTLKLDRSQTEQVTLKPEASILDLLVKLGGVSALLCGMSFITVLELLWVICMACVRCCCSQSHRRRVQNYVQHIAQETPSSDPQPDATQTDTRSPGSGAMYRKDSRSVRKMSSKKRLGGNRRVVSRTGGGSHQFAENLRHLVPLQSSTFRYRRNNHSSGESAAASGNQLVSNQNSSEDSYPSAPPVRQAAPKGELIVPRLNLDDLISHTETEEYPSGLGDPSWNAWSRDNNDRQFHQVPILNVPNPIPFENVFRELQRIRSSGGDRRRPTYEYSGYHKYIREGHARY